MKKQAPMLRDCLAGAATNAAGDLAEVSARLNKILSTLGEARQHHGLSAEETLIFLALGRLGITVTGRHFTTHHVSCQEITDIIRIPKETVRRKAGHLAAFGLIRATGQGLVIIDVGKWCAMASRMTNETVFWCFTN